MKERPYIEIAPDICQSCGACILDCPVHVIEMGNKLNSAGKPYATYKGEGCIGCATCIRSCPSPGAITVYAKGEDKPATEIMPVSEDRDTVEFEPMPKPLYDLFKKTLSGKRDLLTGNEAVVYGALLGGCYTFFGYPITPATEVAELASKLFLPLGRYLKKLKEDGKYDGPIPDFLQAESEVAVINMLYGASGAGSRTMTATSSPGFSLMSEGISYSACAELPMVIVDVMRGGPGLGNIAPSQADYNQLKAPGHGPFKVIILAPNSSQEMCDHGKEAFRLAFRYRIPVIIAADGDIGHGKENVIYPEPLEEFRVTPWAAKGIAETNNVISSIHLDPNEMEVANVEALKKYGMIEAHEVKYEEYNTEGAELILVGYGSVSRTMKDVIDHFKGTHKIGLVRPITLWPFPNRVLAEYANRPEVKGFLVAEQSDGQMYTDVRLAVMDRKPVNFFGRLGGTRVTNDNLVKEIGRLMK